MSDELVTFLRARLDEDEQVAREASRTQFGDGWTPTGEHWHWVEVEHDQVLALDPSLDEYVHDGAEVALRSVERYPSSGGGTLSHHVLSYAQEVRTIDAMHIARWHPARVLAEVDAKRQIIDRCVDAFNDEQDMVHDVLRLLALPYTSHPGYDERWRL